MINEKAAKLEKTARELMNSDLVQHPDRHYLVKIFPEKDELVILIHLLEWTGKLVDVLEIQANSEGFVQAEAVIDSIVTAFEVGLEQQMWKKRALVDKEKAEILRRFS